MRKAAEGCTTTVTAIAGGIGAGKSVVSRVLRVMGYDVYDCDSRAKRLIAEDAELLDSIRLQVCADAVDARGCYDRAAVARVVFADEARLQALNSLVHGAVKADFARWCDARAGHSRLFVETAILHSAGMDAVVDDVWVVTAPDDVRIARVMARNNITAAQVQARLDAQKREEEALAAHEHIIVNDNIHPLLPQILTLLNS